MIQPLFPDDTNDEEQHQENEGYIIGKHKNRIEPISKDLRYGQDRPKLDKNPAADLIRQKVEAVYAQEPSTKQELSELKSVRQLSKHQRFMQSLSTSGKPLAQIHTDWHNYYANLPDNEKHEVWQEFYEANSHRMSSYPHHTKYNPSTDTNNRHLRYDMAASPYMRTLPEAPHNSRRSVEAIRKKIAKHVSARSISKEQAKRHFHSLAFGIGTGLLVLFIFLFGFFNATFIAPFIQPSRQASSTPLIITASSVAPSSTPEVIIPKINVQIPVIYNVTTNENDIENSLENGAIHYASTSVPGEQGNTSIFGHSSNNIFNGGNYKFAFVLLHTLVPGDIFYLTYNDKIYTYSVFDKKIVSPNDVSVLNNVPGKVATATLITCDPPGTSDNRLVVWGEQISPNPAAATPAPSPSHTVAASQLPSDGPSLWGELWSWVFH